MHCSIIISTRNHAPYLDRTLASIRAQRPPFAYELIVIDDGSSDRTWQVCRRRRAEYHRLENDRYRNPAVARNAGYRRARGEVIVAQSDDVVHCSPNVIQRLVTELSPSGEFLIATVYSRNPKQNTSKPPHQYTGLENPRPLFFLGSLWRRDLYAVGGNDEAFLAPGYEDDWFADCLIQGLGLTARYLPNVLAYHQPHPRPYNLRRLTDPSRRLYEQKCQAAQCGEIPYLASSGPWEMTNAQAPMTNVH